MEMEDEYILAALQNFAVEIRSGKVEAETLDKYAVQLSAYMKGRIDGARGGEKL